MKDFMRGRFMGGGEKIYGDPSLAFLNPLNFNSYVINLDACEALHCIKNRILWG